MSVLTPEDVAGVRKPLNEAHWLPAHAYTHPAIWPEECRRILHREWLVVARSDQLRRPGDFMTKEVAGCRLLLVCADDGVARAFHNVCRHRGMWVADGRGKTHNFVCPYHAWTYDLRGRLTAAPEMKRTTRFEFESNGLMPVRCEQWQGFVAVNLDDDAEPFGTGLDELGEFLTPWKFGELVTAHERVYETTWDWKLMWENAIEGYHTSVRHRTSAGDAIPSALSWVSEELDGRPWSDLHHPFAEGWAPPADAPIIEAVPDVTQRELLFFHIWPCLGFYLSPDKVSSYLCEPVAPGRHRFVWRLLVPQKTTERADFDGWRERVAERYDVIQSEDELACRGVQAGLETGAWQPGRYSDKERACWHFHRWYADRMVDDAQSPAKRRERVCR